MGAYTCHVACITSASFCACHSIVIYLSMSNKVDRIEKINKLYDEGHTIIYMTARGAVTKVDYKEFI